MNIIEYLRHFRVFNFAIFDFTLSYVGIFLLSPLLTKLARRLKLNLTTKHWLWLTLPLGLLTHVLFNTTTPLTNSLIDLHGHYSIKLLILFMLFMGLKDIHKKPQKKLNK